MAASLSAPWQSYTSLSLVLGLIGLGNLIYLGLVIRMMRRVPDYQTPLHDWLWYAALPLLAHLLLVGAAITLPANPAQALFFVAAVMIGLLFCGIRNAWDLVTFVVVDRYHSETKDRE